MHTPPELAGHGERVRMPLGLPRAGNLADPSVHLVDPSCGTGTFAAAAHGWRRCARQVPAHARGGVTGWDLDAAAVESTRSALAGSSQTPRGRWCSRPATPSHST
ncbi:MAG: hypothetical protein IPG81_06690 [Sandaracinaceae bacterium]|nr:hypothetical protein [Sandaracinaceae bacterium]